MKVPLLIGLVLVLAVAVLFFGVVAWIRHMVSLAAGKVSRSITARAEVGGAWRPVAPVRKRHCPNEKCGNYNLAAARYCARCGQRLPGT